MTFEEIRKCSKESFKETVKIAVRSKSFKSLIKAKEKQSKGKEIRCEDYSFQEYLQANSDLLIKEKCLLSCEVKRFRPQTILK